MFGSPYHPINIQRFTSSDRHLSLATMTYFSTFIRTGWEPLNQIWLTAVTGLSFYCLLKNILFSARNPNPSRLWADSVLPQWPRVVSSDPSLIYLELSPTLKHYQGLSQRSCSFWNHLASKLTSTSSESHHASLHIIKIKLQLDL